LPRASVDLVYADPPFFSGRIYNTGGCGFDDRWNSLSSYLEWMAPRLRGFKRVLKSTGTVYIHCDWHASHPLKVLADRIFGPGKFLNEIVWKRQSAHSDTAQGSRHFGRIHDTILVYAMSDKRVWNQQYEPYNDTYTKHEYRHIEPGTGRRYALGDLTAPGGAGKKNPHYEFAGTERYWRYSRTKMLELLKAGRIILTKGKTPRLKRYLDEMKGRPIQDVWTDITPVPATGQGVSYPTQKPEALIERIIKTSSNPGQLIYDPFTGSGTTGAVSFKLSRRWIGSEVSTRACRATLNRLTTLGCRVTYELKHSCS